MRQLIAKFTTYGDAQGLKHSMVEQFPERAFQVRARKDGFDVVERTYDLVHNPEKLNPSQRRKKRRHKNIVD